MNNIIINEIFEPADNFTHYYAALFFAYSFSLPRFFEQAKVSTVA